MTEQTGRVEQISIAPPRGGVPKVAVESAEVGPNGLIGDWQRNTELHGGPMRAVCLFSAEVIATLNAEGHPAAAGSCGENLTLSGLDWSAVEVGDQLRVGGAVVLEITQPVAPCSTIKASFRPEVGPKRISHKLHPGQARLYAKVLTGGRINRGDTVSHVSGTGATIGTFVPKRASSAEKSSPRTAPS